MLRVVSRQATADIAASAPTINPSERSADQRLSSDYRIASAAATQNLLAHVDLIVGKVIERTNPLDRRRADRHPAAPGGDRPERVARMDRRPPAAGRRGDAAWLAGASNATATDREAEQDAARRRCGRAGSAGSGAACARIARTAVRSVGRHCESATCQRPVAADPHESAAHRAQVVGSRRHQVSRGTAAETMPVRWRDERSPDPSSPPRSYGRSIERPYDGVSDLGDTCRATRRINSNRRLKLSRNSRYGHGTPNGTTARSADGAADGTDSPAS